MEFTLKTNLPKVRARLPAQRARIRAALFRGLLRGSEIVVKEAKLNLVRNKSTFMGMLGASIGMEPDERRLRVKIGPLLANKATSQLPRNYGYYVEHGRGPGGVPRREIIELWVRRKMGISDPEELARVTGAVLRSIARRGVRARPFLRPAIEQNLARVQKRVQIEVDREASRQNREGGR